MPPEQGQVYGRNLMTDLLCGRTDLVFTEVHVNMFSDYLRDLVSFLVSCLHVNVLREASPCVHVD